MDRRELLILGAASLVILLALAAIWIPRKPMGGPPSGYVDPGGDMGGDSGGHH